MFDCVSLSLLEHDLELLLQFETGQRAAQAPGDLDLFGAEQLLFAAGARRVDVDRREDALVGELTREAQLHVAGALELLEDDLVHLGAGLDERGREDGQRAAALDVARGAEEALRRVERAGVDTTGEDATGCRRGQVVRAAQAGDRVEQHDDVVAQLDEALGALDGELGDRGVVLGGTVEGRGDDLALHRALHVGDLFGALVDEHHHDVHLGVVLGDRLGDGLQDERLAGLRRRDDQAALALADRGDQVDDAGRQLARLGLEAQALVRVDRGELAELDAVRGLLDGLAVDRVDLDDRVVLLATALLRRRRAAGGWRRPRRRPCAGCTS